MQFFNFSLISSLKQLYEKQRIIFIVCVSSVLFIVFSTWFHAYILIQFNPRKIEVGNKSFVGWNTYKSDALQFTLLYPPDMNHATRESMEEFSYNELDKITFIRGYASGGAYAGDDSHNEKIDTMNITINGLPVQASIVDNWSINSVNGTGRRGGGFIHKLFYVYQHTTMPIVIEVNMHSVYDISTWKVFMQMIASMKQESLM